MDDDDDDDEEDEDWEDAEAGKIVRRKRIIIF
jgi:hypothetical protein